MIKISTFEQVKKIIKFVKAVVQSRRKDLEFHLKLMPALIDIKSKNCQRYCLLEKEIEKVQGYKNKKSDTSRNLKNAFMLKKIKSKIWNKFISLVMEEIIKLRKRYIYLKIPSWVFQSCYLY